MSDILFVRFCQRKSKQIKFYVTPENLINQIPADMFSGNRYQNNTRLQIDCLLPHETAQFVFKLFVF